MLETFKQHWPEYLMEATGLGLFMISACGFGVLLEHPASPLRQILNEAFVRRAFMGLAMGGTAVALIYSPWGKRSGAHLNPAVTLTFLRLGKISRYDAVCYMGAQFIGGLLGVLLVAWSYAPLLAHPSVNYVVTAPGAYGAALAFAGEVTMTFILMSVVLRVSNHARFANYAGWCAGTLVALYITFEAPLSGMSMNPARTLASALPAQSWVAWWIYFTAPLLGMLLAAQLYLWRNRAKSLACAKLHHNNTQRCIFCGKPAGVVTARWITSVRSAHFLIYIINAIIRISTSNSKQWRFQMFRSVLRAVFTAAMLLTAMAALAQDMTKSTPFMGVKANTGFVSASQVGGKLVLTLSDDFVVPDTPAPHWQLVDSKGNVYLLNRLKIKEDKYNKTLIVPAYVKDVAKVQIWCAWAEVLLGEAAFSKPIMK